jgi:hypothetical protein
LVLAVLQAADLLTTYQGLASGSHEGNALMRALILTPFAPLVKALPLAFFAALIILSTTTGRPSPRRLIIAACVVVVVYVVIIGNNLTLALRGR